MSLTKASLTRCWKKHEISRKSAGIGSWTASELMHRLWVSGLSWYLARSTCPQKEKVLLQWYNRRWTTRWRRGGRTREKTVKLSKHQLCTMVICAAMYLCVLYSPMCWQWSQQMYLQVRFVIAGVQVGLPANESSCSQEGWGGRCNQKFLLKGTENNVSFAGLRNAVEINLVPKSV